MIIVDFGFTGFSTKKAKLSGALGSFSLRTFNLGVMTITYMDTSLVRGAVKILEEDE